MIKHLLTLAAVASVVAACTSVTVEDPSVCYTSVLGTIPAAPISGISVSGLQYTTQVDYSNVVGKLSNIANSINVKVTELTLSSTSDLSSISELDVDMSTPTLGSTSLASYMGGQPGDSISPLLNVTSDELLTYLSNPVTLTFTVSGSTTTQEIPLSTTICVDVSGNFSKSL